MRHKLVSAIIYTSNGYYTSKSSAGLLDLPFFIKLYYKFNSFKFVFNPVNI